MAGHSHSANIKHKKDAVDKKRAKTFSKIARKLIVGARLGGPDIETNLTLKYAFELARSANMPKDVIQRNIDKGAGIGQADSYEEITYEGYGSGGIAMLVEVLTDNRNRTAPEMRKAFEKGGGKLGAPGSVAFMFDARGVFVVDPEDKSEDDIMEIVMDAEAEDMEKDGEFFVITSEATSFIAVKKALEAAGLKLESSEISMIPKTNIEITDLKIAQRVFKLIDLLEDNDDVQNVYSNYEISDELRAEALA